MAKGSKFKVPISKSEIKREETEPNQMPTFEMDSAYVEDRIEQEIKIEIPESDPEDEPLAKRRRVKQKSKSVKKHQMNDKSSEDDINVLKKQLAIMKEQVHYFLLFQFLKY